MQYQGVFEIVTVSFLIVGHTHNLVDQTFVALTYQLRKGDALSVNLILRACNLDPNSSVTRIYTLTHPNSSVTRISTLTQTQTNLVTVNCYEDIKNAYWDAYKVEKPDCVEVAELTLNPTIKSYTLLCILYVTNLPIRANYVCRGLLELACAKDGNICGLC